MGSRCWIRTKAMPLGTGMPDRSRRKASSPPADAPTPTMGMPGLSLGVGDDGLRSAQRGARAARSGRAGFRDAAGLRLRPFRLASMGSPSTGLTDARSPRPSPPRDFPELVPHARSPLEGLRLGSIDPLYSGLLGAEREAVRARQKDADSRGCTALCEGAAAARGHLRHPSVEPGASPPLFPYSHPGFWNCVYGVGSPASMRGFSML